MVAEKVEERLKKKKRTERELARAGVKLIKGTRIKGKKVASQSNVGKTGP